MFACGKHTINPIVKISGFASVKRTRLEHVTINHDSLSTVRLKNVAASNILKPVTKDCTIKSLGRSSIHPNKPSRRSTASARQCNVGKRVAINSKKVFRISGSTIIRRNDYSTSNCVETTVTHNEQVSISTRVNSTILIGDTTSKP